MLLLLYLGAHWLMMAVCTCALVEFIAPVYCIISEWTLQFLMLLHPDYSWKGHSDNAAHSGLMLLTTGVEQV